VYVEQSAKKDDDRYHYPSDFGGDSDIRLENESSIEGVRRLSLPLEEGRDPLPDALRELLDVEY
jgi:hypothetical protein